MCGIASVYQDDYINNTATIAANTMKRSTIDSIKVYTQDAEFKLDKLDKLDKLV
jgi:hypothetical protein